MAKKKTTKKKTTRATKGAYVDLSKKKSKKKAAKKVTKKVTKKAAKPAPVEPSDSPALPEDRSDHLADSGLTEAVDLEADLMAEDANESLEDEIPF